MNVELILQIYVGVVIICNLFWWFICCPVAMIHGLCFINPTYIYKNTKLNWFGTVVICIVANLAFGPASLIYWLCKIFTVGRKC